MANKTCWKQINLDFAYYHFPCMNHTVHSPLNIWKLEEYVKFKPTYIVDVANMSHIAGRKNTKGLKARLPLVNSFTSSEPSARLLYNLYKNLNTNKQANSPMNMHTACRYGWSNSRTSPSRLFAFKKSAHLSKQTGYLRLAPLFKQKKNVSLLGS